MTEETKLILEKLDKIEARLDSMEEKYAEVYSCIVDLNKNFTGIKMLLDNEIRNNVENVMKSNVDIKNNLIDAFVTENYLRVLQITMNSLESELRDLKIKVGAYT